MTLPYRPTTVLLLAPDETTRARFRSPLQTVGFSVLTATTADDARAMLRAAPRDALLLVAPGTAMRAALAQACADSGTPIVAVTTPGKAWTPDPALLESVLVAPISGATLIAAIQYWLAPEQSIALPSRAGGHVPVAILAGGAAGGGLLIYLSNAVNTVIASTEIAELLGLAPEASREVDQAMSRLRDRLDAAGIDPALIVQERDGYALRVPVLDELLELPLDDDRPTGRGPPPLV